MIRLNKITITFIVLCTSLFVASSQNIHDLEHSRQFAAYLFKTKQFKLAAEEYERILFLDPTDEGNKLDLIKSYRLAGESAMALKKVETLYPYTKHDFIEDLAKEYVRIIFNENKLEEVQGFVQSNRHLPPMYKKEVDISIYLLTKEWDKAYQYSLLEPDLNKSLTDLVNQANNIRYKSPALAATMSAVIPGTGKIYAGQWKDGIIGLVFIASSAWQSYRGFQKNGAESAYGWIFGGISVGFYTGNIFGSHKAVREFNQKKDLNIVNKTRAYFTRHY